MDSRPFNTVSVIGLGYTGLPTAAFIASTGTPVVGVDHNEKRVEQINRGVLPFVEPGFDDFLATVVERGLLRAQTQTPRADAYVVAVPTPFDENRNIDMTYILSAATAIAAQLSGGELIVLESTSPPGTTQRLAEFVMEQRPDLTLDDGEPNTIYFAHAPERVLPGKVMVEMAANDRVIGGITPAAGGRAKALYQTFSQGQILTSDSKTAEMVKLTENTFRDVNIAFANELSIICDELDINVWELIKLANHHPRVNILQPGPGVGGHCIAVDPWFIVSSAPDSSNLIRTARETNDAKPAYVVQKVLAALDGLENPSIACLGLAFKPNIGDLRGSPAVEIVYRVAQARPDATINAVEPHTSELPGELTSYTNVHLTELDRALGAADVILLLVDHIDFRNLQPKKCNAEVIDTRGIWQ